MGELSAFGVIHKSASVKAIKLGAGRKLLGPKNPKALKAVKEMRVAKSSTQENVGLATSLGGAATTIGLGAKNKKQKKQLKEIADNKTAADDMAYRAANRTVDDGRGGRKYAKDYKAGEKAQKEIARLTKEQKALKKVKAKTKAGMGVGIGAALGGAGLYALGQRNRMKKPSTDIQLPRG